MTGNSVHSKLYQFTPQTISLSKFQNLLESSTRNNPIRVQWETLEGFTDYYWMYWDSNAYVGGDAGGSNTKAEEGMFNIQCLGLRPKWRTLSLQTVSKCRFENKLYLIK
jgi:hypothetical protein